MSKLRKTPTGWDGYSIRAGYLWLGDEKVCAINEPSFSRVLESPHTKAIRVESLEFDYTEMEWVDYDTIVVSEVDAQFTIRKEVRGNYGHWYGYRRAHRTLHKRYVGTSDLVTEERLNEIARKLPTTRSTAPRVEKR